LYLLLRYAKEFCHSQIKNIGVSDTEHLICTFLLGHYGGSQDDVAEALKLEKATVARALLSLEKKGYVERSINSDNRRKYILTLTQFGKESIAEVSDIYDVWLQKISSCLTEQEQKQFDEYCKRLLIVSEELCKEIK
jgi:DNA-binding MarR family transcriptional regulator